MGNSKAKHNIDHTIQKLVERSIAPMSIDTCNGPSLSTSNSRIDHFLSSLDHYFQLRDVAKITDLFGDGGDAYWRDLLAFTWNIITVEGRGEIARMLESTLEHTNPKGLIRDSEATAYRDDGLQAWFRFETDVGICKGHLRMKGDGKCRTLFTAIAELKGYPEQKGKNRPYGAEHGVIQGRKTWLDRRKEEEQTLGFSIQPYCVIVGGGQAGIGLGARLKQLQVPTLILEKNCRAGHSWRNRYKSLCLHDPVWSDHLPYLQFPETWPVFSPKDKMGDWLEMYTKVMELNYWSSTECLCVRFEEGKKEWSVLIRREGKEMELRPKQLVLATGVSGMPNVPQIPNAERFKGEIYHSSAYSCGERYRGKRAVVVGSNNSAHDIAADLWENEADVTMIQRSSTHVCRSDSLLHYHLADVYSESAVESGITTDLADMMLASIPYKIMPEFQRPVTDKIRAQDADFYKDLQKSGFMLNFGDDETGLGMMNLRRGSGYYIDVGCSELIIQGKVKLKTKVNIVDVREEAVVLSDGTELGADVIILATGYGSMNGWAARLISKEVANKVGKCWGLGSNTTKDPGPWEGELRNMWKPTRQEALWFHGGNLHKTRHYSLYVAFQLKARMEGIPTPVYGLPSTVYHLS